MIGQAAYDLLVGGLFAAFALRLVWRMPWPYAFAYGYALVAVVLVFA